MGIETDLNVSPYFDDANNAISDNYHRILFRPSVPVQARELTQLQDILQNQIERFGDNIFLEGTIIKGCNFNFDANYYYTKILDTRPLDGQPANPSEYVNLLAHDETSNLYAVCVDYQDGFESQDPNLKTLYFKYINSGTNNEQSYAAGATLKFYTNTNPTYANATNYFANGDITVASVANAVGQGYAMSVSAGVVFQKGHFIQVANNTSVIVTKYTNTPNNMVVGFDIEENIITELQDTNLLDGATGSPNYAAPGAHRLQLIPTLAAYDIDTAPNTNFFALVEWQDGRITKSFQKTQYSELGNEMAQRTFEESGNYFIRPFRVHVENANTDYNYVVTSAGLAYIEGHRVEQLNNIKTLIRKGTDMKTVSDQILNSNYNNSILVKEYIGNFPSNVGATVSIRDTAGTKITSRAFGSISASGNEIGTAKILAVTYESGTVGTSTAKYRVYLADIRMNLGKNFRDARAIYYSGSPAGFADIDLTYDATLKSNVAMIAEPSKSCLVFKTSKSGLDNFADTGTLPDYTYRTVSNSLINYTTGNSNLIELTGTAIFPYAEGQLSAAQEQEVVIIPTSFASGANNCNTGLATTGTLAVVSGNNVVLANSGNTTSFLSEYQVGDYINAANTVRRIVSISNNTTLTVDAAYGSSNTNATHRKTYPVDVPINLTDRNNYLTITDSASQHMQLTLVAANGTQENLVSNAVISVYHNVILPNDSDRNLQANTSIAVRLNLANNSAGTNGPWCLGIPYAYNLRAVYKSSNTGTFTANSSPSNTYLLTDTTGFANGVSISGFGIPAGATANVANSTALLLSAAATANISGGQFTYGYYSNATADDITQAFYIKDGQKDAFFDQSFLVKNSNYRNITLNSTDLLTVVFDAFLPQNTGKGYISIDSYDTIIHTVGSLAPSPTINFGYENIPNYTSSAGVYYELRDSVDFRPFVQNTASYQTSYTTSVINPPYSSTLPTSENYIAAPNQRFVYSANYYVGRVDKLMINSYGDYSIVEGLASEFPVAPADKSDTMTLATITIPPYPSLSETTLTTNTATKYLVTTKETNQNRVYTMKDIAKLDQRVNNLEYYTSLNLLEQQTSSLTILSSITGANRFKNGIFVDNFSTADNLDLSSPEFRASLSSSETALIPLSVPTKIPLRFANGFHTVQTGSLVTLANTAAPGTILQQKFGSNTRACTDTYYNYVGQLSLHPQYEELPELIVPTPPTPTPSPKGNINTRLDISIQKGISVSSTTAYVGFTGFNNIPAGLIHYDTLGIEDTIALYNRYFNLALAKTSMNYYRLGQQADFIAPESGSYSFSATCPTSFLTFMMVGDTTSSGTGNVTLTKTLTAGQKYWFDLSIANYVTDASSKLDLSFTVNGTTYKFNPSSSEKPILPEMFIGRGYVNANTTINPSYANNSTVNSTAIGVYTDNLTFASNNVITTQDPTLTGTVQTKPVITDISKG